MLPTTSPSLAGEYPETSASGSCHSTTGPGAAAPHCTPLATSPDRPGVLPDSDRSSSETQGDRTRSVLSCGGAHKCHSFAGASPWCGCGQCSPPPGTTHTRDGQGCRSPPCPDRSGPG